MYTILRKQTKTEKHQMEQHINLSYLFRKAFQFYFLRSYVRKHQLNSNCSCSTTVLRDKIWWTIYDMQRNFQHAREFQDTCSFSHETSACQPFHPIALHVSAGRFVWGLQGAFRMFWFAWYDLFKKIKDLWNIQKLINAKPCLNRY